MATQTSFLRLLPFLAMAWMPGTAFAQPGVTFTLPGQTSRPPQPPYTGNPVQQHWQEQQARRQAEQAAARQENERRAREAQAAAARAERERQEAVERQRQEDERARQEEARQRELEREQLQAQRQIRREVLRQRAGEAGVRGDVEILLGHEQAEADLASALDHRGDPPPADVRRVELPHVASNPDGSYTVSARADADASSEPSRRVELDEGIHHGPPLAPELLETHRQLAAEVALAARRDIVVTSAYRAREPGGHQGAHAQGAIDVRMQGSFEENLGEARRVSAALGASRQVILETVYREGSAVRQLNCVFYGGRLMVIRVTRFENDPRRATHIHVRPALDEMASGQPVE